MSASDLTGVTEDEDEAMDEKDEVVGEATVFGFVAGDVGEG